MIILGIRRKLVLRYRPIAITKALNSCIVGHLEAGAAIAESAARGAWRCFRGMSQRASR